MDNLSKEIHELVKMSKNADVTGTAVKDDNKYVGICYVPMQQWEEIYGEEAACMAGTIFPCLDKPFLGGEYRPKKDKYEEDEGGGR